MENEIYIQPVLKCPECGELTPANVYLRQHRDKEIKGKIGVYKFDLLDEFAGVDFTCEKCEHDFSINSLEVEYHEKTEKYYN